MGYNSKMKTEITLSEIGAVFAGLVSLAILLLALGCVVALEYLLK